MNVFLTLFLLSVGSMALAQTASNASVNTIINDDGKTMSIQIDGQRNKKPIKYKRSFNVSKLSSSEREALKNRVLDSLGINEPPGVESPRVDAPVSPTVPTPPSPVNANQPVVTFQCETCAGKVKLVIANESEDFAIERDAKANTDKRMFPYKMTLGPGDYKLIYYQNGVLQIQSTFTVKAGDTNTVVVK